MRRIESRLSRAAAVAVVTAVVAAFCALLAAPVQGQRAAAPDAALPRRGVVRLATAAPGGRLHQVGEAVAQLWREALPGWTVVAVATGGSPQNVELLADGDVDAALLTGEAAYEAFRGLGTWSGKPRSRYETLRLLARLYFDVVHLVTRGDARPAVGVGVGLPGSRDEYVARRLLAPWVGDGDEGVALRYLALQEALDHYQLGWIDGVMHLGPVPSPALVSALTQSRPGTMELRSLDEAMLAGAAKLGWAEPFTVPAGTYPRQLAPVQTVAVPVVIAVRADMEPALAGRLAEALRKGRARLESAAPPLLWESPGAGGEGGLLPWHPGAR